MRFGVMTTKFSIRFSACCLLLLAPACSCLRRSSTIGDFAHCACCLLLTYRDATTGLGTPNYGKILSAMQALETEK
jgi:hypothetical protein